MKKIKVLFIFFLLVLLAGCNANNNLKEVKCNKSYNEDDIEISNQIIGIFQDDVLQSVKGTISWEYETSKLASGTYKYISYVESSFKESGFKVSSSVNDKTITLNFNATIEEMQNAENATETIFDKESSASFISSLKSQEYICK